MRAPVVYLATVQLMDKGDATYIKTMQEYNTAAILFGCCLFHLSDFVIMDMISNPSRILYWDIMHSYTE